MICAAPPYQPPHDVPHYSLAVTIPAHGDVTGTETVTFRAPRTTRRIVLRLWANAPATRVAGARETAEVVRATPRVTVLGADPTTLDLRLARPLRRGARATVRLRFRLAPASGGLTRVGRARSFVRLGSFFPILALDRGGVWATDPPSILAAETSTSPTANFDVRVHGPPRWTVLTTGVRVGRGRFTAKLVRDFAIATGRLARVSVVAHAPSAVTVTAVAPSRPLAAAFAGRAALALQALSRRYGPYPWPRFGVAASNDLGRSGIEYPNLVFEGTAALGRATAHETAHQWFYSLVGNNQARDPWLDEALASWAMTRVDAGTRGILGLPIPPEALGHLTAPMRIWDEIPSDYFAGVYVQGARAFASLGDGDRTDCALRLYVARNAYGIAGAQDLVDALADRLPPAALRRFAAYG